jgi:ribosome assembly protein 1
VSKIVTTLNLKIPPRELKSKDTRNLLQLVMSQWLSLSTCIIQATIDIVPPPSSAQLNRIPKILYPDLLEPTIPPKNKLEKDLWSCDDGEEAFVIAYVSKMFAVPVKDLPENKKVAATAEQMRANAKAARERAATALATTDEANGKLPLTMAEASNDQGGDVEGKEKEEVNEDRDILLGFARIYSGTIRVGSKVRCVLPKYNNNFPPTHPRNIPNTTTVMAEGLYTMMGKDLVRVDSVPAGNVFAIRGLEGTVMRSATICAPNHQGLLDEGVESGNSEYILNLGGVLRPVLHSSSPLSSLTLELTFYRCTRLSGLLWNHEFRRICQNL